MQDEKRDILMQVANKTLSPEEAAARIEELERAGREDTAPATSLRAVRVEALARSVVVLGDAGVAEAVAEGPHSARREGDTLVIEGAERNALGFRFGPRFAVDVEDRPLLVKMNPGLALEIDLQAGSLSAKGVRGPISGRVQAGKARIDDFEGPLDLEVQAGDLRARGRIDHGESRVRCDAGAVRLELERDSNVAVTARSRLGKVELPNGGYEWQAGSGAGRLSIDVGIGKAEVRLR